MNIELTLTHFDERMWAKRQFKHITWVWMKFTTQAIFLFVIYLKFLQLYSFLQLLTAMFFPFKSHLESYKNLVQGQSSQSLIIRFSGSCPNLPSPGGSGEDEPGIFLGLWLLPRSVYRPKFSGSVTTLSSWKSFTCPCLPRATICLRNNLLGWTIFAENTCF